MNEERFAPALQQGYLVANGQGGFRATESEESVAQKLWQTINQSVAHLQPMPDDALHRLASYLARIADAAPATPESPSPSLPKANASAKKPRR